MAGLRGMNLGSVAAFAGGVFAGALAGRVLPPVFGHAAGAARAWADGDPFEALTQDHRKIVKLLHEMETCPGDATFGRAQRLLRVKRRLAAHAMAEEDVVYPLLADKTLDVERTNRLYADHAEIKRHLYALEQMPKGEARWSDTVRRLRETVEQHVREEENVEFPRLRALLDERGLFRLSAQMQREKALVL